MTSNQFSIQGPPGAGKTHTLTSVWIPKAADRFGADGVAVCSLTRTAALEIAGRVKAAGIEIPAGQVGTLHSLCYRALGAPELADKHLDDWNSVSGLGMRQRPTRGVSSHDPLGRAVWSDDYPGDAMRAVLDLARHRLEPVGGVVRKFAELWSDWKTQNGYIDFTDMIEMGISELPICPGGPKVFIADEAQDMSALEMSLVRQWGAGCEYFVSAGDPNQAIYRWRGAEAGAMLDGVNDENRRVLRQSYRLPDRVLRHAERFLSRAYRSWRVDYAPRKDENGETVEGHVRRTVANFEDTWAYTLLSDVNRDLDEGRSVMILASCGFLLPLRAFKEHGLYFGNHYKTDHGGWNPGRAGLRRLAAMIVPPCRQAIEGLEPRSWTWRELWQWVEPLSAKRAGLRHGAKERVSKLAKRGSERHAVLDPADLDEVFHHEHVSAWPFKGSAAEIVTWYGARILESWRSRMTYAMRLVSRDEMCLVREPRVTVGTVHCSPPDEPVLTVNRWYVPIGSLDAERDRLMSFTDSTNTFSVVGRNGKEWRPDLGASFVSHTEHYGGDLVVMETDASRCRVTPDHRVRVRYSDAFYGKHCVYLMRRGDWWRIGFCVTAHRPYRSGGVCGRLATEKGDVGWILKVCGSRSEAAVEEATLQARYGIPGLTFESGKNRALDVRELHAIHRATAVDVSARINRLFDDTGLLRDAPLYVRPKHGDVRRNMASYWFETVAANVLGGFMDVPVAVGDQLPSGSPEGRVVSVTREAYSGPVVSLQVDPYGHYVSGGQVVHNSVKGGQADSVYLSPSISRAGDEQRESGPEGADDLYRLFYVGMTRARERLTLLAPNRKAESVDFG